MHPVLINLGFIKIYSYGFCLAIAFLLGIAITAMRAKRYGESPTEVIDLGLFILLAAIVGSRLLYIIYNLEYFIDHPKEIIMIQRGGLVFYGGIIASILVALLFFKKRKLSILKYADIFAPAIPLGQAIGRMGCFLNGCCYGKPTFADWGVVYPLNTPGGRANFFQLNLHPTQIYSSLALLAIFVFLCIFEKYKKFNSQVFLMYGVLYSLFRFFIEFVRIDSPKWILSRYTTSQVMSVVLLILSLIGMIIERKYQAKKNIPVVLPK